MMLRPDLPLVLVGFMGAGKTTVGRFLAESMGRTFIDLDGEIEATTGKTISSIFAESGETAFREIECTMLAAFIGDRPPGVIAAGGGAVFRRANRDLLRRQAVTIFLDPPFDEIWRRVQHEREHRPVAAGKTREELETLYLERYQLYRESASMTVSTSEKPGAIADSIIFRFESFEKWTRAGICGDDREILESRRKKL